ncbi:hypothetical protein [Nannocystis punicea]|uniref:Uncharacterized protein n=1 Tax=Nannocystis punicea TaxID=2995304 RepID=A0ABY7H6D8_9BACT|nr:hypothetical protein [Nannocystis poenicansa]WAS94842.1 hypothetical protein O0S08_01665 [Nannocystis poenicansa]
MKATATAAAPVPSSSLAPPRPRPLVETQEFDDSLLAVEPQQPRAVATGFEDIAAVAGQPASVPEVGTRATTTTVDASDSGRASSTATTATVDESDRGKATTAGTASSTATTATVDESDRGKATTAGTASSTATTATVDESDRGKATTAGTASSTATVTTSRPSAGTETEAVEAKAAKGQGVGLVAEPGPEDRQAANDGGAPRAATGAPARGGGLRMPEPPDAIGRATAARIEKVRATAGATANANASLPSAAKTVNEATAAVTEPEAETRGRAAGAVAEALDRRPPPSPKLQALCEKIRKDIREKRPPDDAALLKAKPEEAAKSAGAELKGNVKSEAESVADKYAPLDKPPAGESTLQPKAYEQPPVAVTGPEVNASAAAPDPLPGESVSLTEDVAAQKQRIADAGMDTEPARLIESGPIADARAAHAELEKKSQEEPEKLLQRQQEAIQSAQADMTALQTRSLTTLAGTRSEAIGERARRQRGIVGTQEQMRAAAGKRMREIFAAAQSEVHSRLDRLMEAAMTKWEAGLAVATREFKTTLRSVEEWIAKRHEGAVGVVVELIDDWTGYPKWVTQQYDKAETRFGDTVCGLILDISRDVEAVIRLCEEVISEARAEIDKVVKTAIEQGIGDFATGEATAIYAQLDALQSRANSVRDDFTDELVKRADAAVQEVRREVQALREAAGGIVGRIGAAIEAALEDPARFIIDGLLTLASIPPPSFWALVDKVQHVVKDIADDPVGFANNLLAGVGQGFQRFFDNLGTHLQEGFLSWLFSGLGSVGVTLPPDFSLRSVVTLFLQLMGLTWPRIRTLLAKHIGEDNLALIEQALALVSTLIEQGPEGIFQMIQEQLDPQQLVDMVIQMAVDYMVNAVIKQVVARVIAMFNPAGAIVAAVEAIYRVLKWVFENAARIFSLVETVVNGMADIVAGKVSAMATAVEGALAGMVGPVIDFVAGYFGLGDLPQKIAEFIGKLQDRVLAVVDRVIGFLADKARALLAKVRGGEKEAEPGKEEAVPEEVAEKFVDQDNESHTITAETDEDPPDISVQSVRILVMELIKKRRKKLTAGSKQAKALNSAEAKYKVCRLAVNKRRRKWEQYKAERMKSARKTLLDELRAEVLEQRKEIHALADLLVKSGALDKRIEPSHVDFISSPTSKQVVADPLTLRPGNTVGSAADTKVLTDWDQRIQKQSPKRGGKLFWRRVHLLPASLNGPGNDPRNIVPGGAGLNKWLERYESAALKALTEEKRTLKYEVTATLNPSDGFFPLEVTVMWKYKGENNDPDEPGMGPKTMDVRKDIPP